MIYKRTRIFQNMKWNWCLVDFVALRYCETETNNLAERSVKTSNCSPIEKYAMHHCLKHEYTRAMAGDSIYNKWKVKR